MVKKIKPKGQDDKDPNKEILEPDQFITRSASVFDWIQDNSSKVLTVIAVFFGAVALLGLVTFFQNSRNSASSKALAEAMRVYHRPVSTVEASTDTPADEKPFATAKEKYTASKDALLKVVQEHGNTGAGAMARLYLADSHVHLGEYDDAIKQYEEYLKATGGADTLRFMALEGLAHAKEAKGDLKGAAETFTQMTQLEGKVGKDYALYNAGRVRLALNEKDQGKQMLERLVKEFETSPLKPKAEELLSTLQ
ncbi:MAG: tetratricopeptide repeat protein [Myxococcota bacterium]